MQLKGKRRRDELASVSSSLETIAGHAGNELGALVNAKKVRVETDGHKSELCGVEGKIYSA